MLDVVLSKGALIASIRSESRTRVDMVDRVSQDVLKTVAYADARLHV